MKISSVIIIILLVVISMTLNAQNKNEVTVKDAVEQFRKTMLDPDSILLDKLTSSKLSYGHSGGHIDGKTEFIQKLTSGQTDFVTLEFTEITISVSKNMAIVRHKLNAVTNDNKKPGEVHLAVMLIWQKQRGHWKLMARQAIKVQ